MKLKITATTTATTKTKTKTKTPIPTAVARVTLRDDDAPLPLPYVIANIALVQINLAGNRISTPCLGLLKSTFEISLTMLV